MLSDRDRLALSDIRENIELAVAFTSGMTLESFAADRRTLYAVQRCLEIISEASRRISGELKSRHAEIAWQQMASAGNVYRHDYSNVEDKLVWDTVRHHLTPLLSVVVAELAASPPNPGSEPAT
jgi:uncharacterized protein with HEPN domain